MEYSEHDNKQNSSEKSSNDIDIEQNNQQNIMKMPRKFIIVHVINAILILGILIGSLFLVEYMRFSKKDYVRKHTRLCKEYEDNLMDNQCLAQNYCIISYNGTNFTCKYNVDAYNDTDPNYTYLIALIPILILLGISGGIYSHYTKSRIKVYNVYVPSRPPRPPRLSVLSSSSSISTSTSP